MKNHPVTLQPPQARRLWHRLAKQGLVKGIVLSLGCSVLLSAALAQPVTERSKQKRAAEKERAELQQRLANLKRDINKTEAAKDSAADALAESELAISQANRSLRELAEEQRHTAAKLAQLDGQLRELTRVVNAQQTQLATMLREQYIAGNEDRVKLLLSGDNPNRINREMQLMGYVSQAQAQLVETLRANLQAVRDNKTAAQNAKFELDEIAQEEREQKAILEKEKAKRSTLVAALANKLSVQRKEAGTLQKNEQRLSGLVDQLAKVIEEQNRAQAAARERRRQEQLARAQQEQAAAAQRPSGTAGQLSSQEMAAVAPKPIARNDVVPEADGQQFGRAFASLKGQLRLPVRGELMAKYGSARADGPSWKGLFIRASEGAPVHAVANGRVVYADWLRGFGNLIIVDHGAQYMTIYGFNQSVLKNVGDMVKTGDVIASAGNSGGNEESGLYFEMRYQGRAFDPQSWVTSR
jgi:septal ring factor EnvC (AmiA/AmiB activator)